MDIAILQNIWFCLIALLLAIFIMLGGFDFGACILAIKSRRASDFAMRSILPFWDANQVWLITTGGALFAAFPAAYSTSLSELYIPVMLFIAAIITRVASIEFYFAKPQIAWRTFWRFTACISSATSFLLLGIALCVIFTGNVIGREGGFFERFALLFNLKTIFCGLTLLLFSITHGALFLCANSKEGRELFCKNCKAAFLLLIICFAFYASNLLPTLNILSIIIFCASLAVLILAFLLFIRKHFTISIITNAIFALLAVSAHTVAAYPSIIAPEITISNSSSVKTLSIMLLVAGVGVPIILAYTAYTYRIFLKKK